MVLFVVVFTCGVLIECAAQRTCSRTSREKVADGLLLLECRLGAFIKDSQKQVHEGLGGEVARGLRASFPHGRWRTRETSYGGSERKQGRGSSDQKGGKK